MATIRHQLKAHDKELAAKDAEHQATVDELADAHDVVMSKMQAEHAAQVEQIRTEYATQGLSESDALAQCEEDLAVERSDCEITVYDYFPFPD